MSTAEQVTERSDWLQSRKSAIGASDVAAILGASPFAGPWEVWADKTNRLEPWKGNNATRAGQAFENAVLDQAEQELGKLERNIRVVHESLPMSATLDARLAGAHLPVEAKTTGIVGPVYGNWGEAMTDEVPEYYLVQVHAQLCVTGSVMAYLFALIAGRGVVQFQIQRSDKLCERLGNICADWWHQHVILDQEPSREIMPPHLDVVKRLRRVADKKTTFGPVVAKLVERRERLNQARLTIEKRVKQLDASVLMALGDAEAASFDGGELTYFKQSRAGYAVAPTEFRVMRIKLKGTK